MSRSKKNARRLQERYSHLPEPQRRVVTELAQVFASRQHGLWSGETYHASPLRFDELRKVRERGLDNLSNSDIGSLMFSVMTTIGSQETMKFLLPRFFAAYFTSPDYGWIVEPLVIVDRLKRAGFESWPVVERKPVLEALTLAAQHEIGRGRAYDYVSDDDLEALVWAQARLAEAS